MSQTITIELPDEVFLGLQKTPDQMAVELPLAASVKWYEAGLISQGKAAASYFCSAPNRQHSK